MKASASLCSERAVRDALRRRYPGSAWAFFENVSNATGGRASRWADALVMSVWPSRGLALHGFEIKVSRNDWLRELKNPKKGDEVGRYCDFWWVAAGSAEIAKVDELPPSWGLLVPVAAKGSVALRVVKDAVQLSPTALDRDFVAAILRRAAEQFDVGSLRRQIHDEIYVELNASIRTRVEEQHEAEIRGLQKQVEDGRQATSTAREQLQQALGASHSPEVLQRALTLLHTLEGWNGAEPTITRALSALDHHVVTLGSTRDGLRSALELVQILVNKQPPPTETR